MRLNCPPNTERYKLKASSQLPLKVKYGLMAVVFCSALTTGFLSVFFATGLSAAAVFFVTFLAIFLVAFLTTFLAVFFADFFAMFFILMCLCFYDLKV